MDSAIHLRAIARTLRASAIGALLLLAVALLSDVLLLVFASLLIASVLRGGANAMHRQTGLGERWCLLAIVVLLLLVIGAILWWRGPEIAQQAVQMTDQLTAQVQTLWQMLGQSDWGGRLVDRLRSSRWSMVGNVTGYAPQVASSVLGLGGTLVVVIATAMFFAASPGLYRHGVLRLLPVPWRPRGAEVLDEVGESLRLWFLGQFADMVIVTVLIGTGLFLLGVPLAPTLALVAGLLNFVPYVGALAGSLPAILVALAQSPGLALWVALLFVVVQTLEGNVIAPLIQKRTVALPPVLTIISQTVLGTLFGALGLILATPFVAAAMVTVRMVYVEGILERSSPEQKPSPCSTNVERETKNANPQIGNSQE